MLIVLKWDEISVGISSDFREGEMGRENAESAEILFVWSIFGR